MGRQRATGSRGQRSRGRAGLLGAPRTRGAPCPSPAVEEVLRLPASECLGLGWEESRGPASEEPWGRVMDSWDDVGEDEAVGEHGWAGASPSPRAPPR